MVSIVAVQCPHVPAALPPASSLTAKTQTLCCLVWLIPNLDRPGASLHLTVVVLLLLREDRDCKYMDTPSSAPNMYDYTC